MGAIFPSIRGLIGHPFVGCEPFSFMSSRPLGQESGTIRENEFAKGMPVVILLNLWG
jgi:hypothetical protein